MGFVKNCPARLGLSKKIGTLLVAPFIGALIAVLVLWFFLILSAEAPAQVNLAGRQRMLILQISDWVVMVENGQDEDRPKLGKLVTDYERALLVLRNGGESDGRYVNSVGKFSQLEDMEVGWAGVHQDLRRIADGEEADFAHVKTVLEELRFIADDMTFAIEERMARRRQITFGFFVGGLGLNFLVLLFGLGFARRYIISPVMDVEAAARRVTQGDFSVHVECQTKDELCELARSFNHMAGTIQGLIQEVELGRKEAESLTRSLPLGTALLDEDLTIIRCNPAFSEMFELDGREQVHLSELFSSDVREAVASVLKGPATLFRMESAERLSHMLEARGSSGGERFYRVSAVQSVADENLPARLLLVVEECTREERIRAEVATLEAKFTEVVEHATDAITMMNGKGKITFFNQSAERLFGYPREDAIGRELTDLMPEKYRAGHRKGLTRFMESGERTLKRQMKRVEGLRRDGTTFPIEYNVSACEVGGELLFTGFLRDITDRLKAEDALQRSEASLRALIESSPDGIAVHRDGVFVYVNPAVVRLLGYDSADDLIGQPVNDRFLPDEAQALEDRKALLLETGVPTPPREFKLLRKSGEVLSAEIAAISAEYEGEPSIIAVARDLSERKQLAARMMEVDRMIAVATLAAGVGHEINNPLTYVMANLDLVQEELQERGVAKSDPVRELLESAHQGAGRIRDIVKDISTLSRIEEGELVPINVQSLLKSAINVVRNEVSHRASLIQEFDGVADVLGHPTKLSQVFINLLVNAAQAMSVGDASSNTIWIRTKMVSNEVCIEIEDTGAGIPAAILARIFDPFFTTKPVGQGTGLGLSISRKAIESMGGRLEVESEVGKGTKFCVLLPAQTSSTQIDEPSSEPQLVRKARIMIVEDEELIGLTMELALGMHEVEHFLSGYMALEALRRGETYDLCFVDMMMPQMSGRDFYAHIEREFPNLLNRIVFMTGGAFTHESRVFLQEIKNLCVEKPMGVNELRKLVQERLELLSQAD